MTPAIEPKLTNPDEVQDVIRGLKVSKAPVPNGIPNRVLKHLPQRAISLLAQILPEVSERGLLRDEQFGFRPRHSTSLQLARLVERVTRNFGEKGLTGAVFLDVAKSFDTVWIDGLLYKLTLLNFLPYIVNTIS
jgi:hypothetical protein